jgi:hypothetical protein
MFPPLTRTPPLPRARCRVAAPRRLRSRTAPEDRGRAPLSRRRTTQRSSGRRSLDVSGFASRAVTSDQRCAAERSHCKAFLFAIPEPEWIFRASSWCEPRTPCRVHCHYCARSGTVDQPFRSQRRNVVSARHDSSFTARHDSSFTERPWSSFTERPWSSFTERPWRRHRTLSSASSPLVGSLHDRPDRGSGHLPRSAR